ncbi:hypothetical protein BU24DRAFT_461742 [Aaosphaeria arxii CBS 175.79]|uniref:Jacalin-type lectin domain-containing protein n=1 Tax=Aaosphaeria arxii CBS 175.79 TaxID=1450172 RepID=A0A6A5XQE9_9PLEO|nr:uncharacterized protein BU24DRAFT_461742 [Aaosphaeria arxii CBS 175.79]KAF2015498.1 hypothetical protein BU24DRAFT_461742 [Aaosphaeria arxii CBS 175.79]
MYFSPKTLLLSAFTALLAAPATARYCGDGPWSNSGAIGGEGGEEFCETRFIKDGLVMKGFQVWDHRKKGIIAIQFHYSDGSTSKTYGRQTEGDVQPPFTWDPATVKVSQLKLWGNGRGTRSGAVYVRLSDGREAQFGKSVDGQDTYEWDVASGIMLNAYGAHGDMIDRLGFNFLKSKVEKVTIDNVAFKETPEELNKRQKGIESKTIRQQSLINDSGTAIAEKFGETVEEENTRSFSETLQHNFGFSVTAEVSGKILDLGASASTTLSYGYTNTQESSETTRENVVILRERSYTVEPRSSLYCRATAYKGTYEAEYTSTVTVHLADGDKIEFEREGVMEQLTWSEAETHCSDKPLNGTRAVAFRA